MNNDIRLLTADDFDYVRSFVMSRKRIGGTEPISPERFDEIHKNSQSSDRQSIGYFEDDTLISWIDIGFYQSKMRGKFWAITGLCSIKQEQRFHFMRSDIAPLISKAFEIAEGKEYFQYFYCISERLERVYETQWRKNNPLNYRGKYDLSTLAIVPANTKPEFELYWRLMGQELKPDNVAIKARVLKGYNPLQDK